MKLTLASVNCKASDNRTANVYAIPGCNTCAAMPNRGEKVPVVNKEAFATSSAPPTQRHDQAADDDQLKSGAVDAADTADASSSTRSRELMTVQVEPWVGTDRVTESAGSGEEATEGETDTRRRAEATETRVSAETVSSKRYCSSGKKYS